MALEFGEHEREGVTILALKGRITVGEVTPVRDKITELVAAGHIQIVLDLQHVDYIDSTGLGNVVISYTQVKNAGGALKLKADTEPSESTLVATSTTTSTVTEKTTSLSPASSVTVMVMMALLVPPCASAMV